MNRSLDVHLCILGQKTKRQCVTSHYKNAAYGQQSTISYVCDQGVPILYHQSEQIPKKGQGRSRTVNTVKNGQYGQNQTKPVKKGQKGSKTLTKMSKRSWC